MGDLAVHRNLWSWPSPIHVILNSPYYVSNLCMEDNLSLMLGPLYLKVALEYRVMTLQLCFLQISLHPVPNQSTSDTTSPMLAQVQSFTSSHSTSNRFLLKLYLQSSSVSIVQNHTQKKGLLSKWEANDDNTDMCTHT